MLVWALLFIAALPTMVNFQDPDELARDFSASSFLVWFYKTPLGPPFGSDSLENSERGRWYLHVGVHFTDQPLIRYHVAHLHPDWSF
jgi:hypothetical protein